MTFREKLASASKGTSGLSSLTIAALGDSVTQGCFEARPVQDGSFDEVYDYEAVYHARLRQMLQYLFPRVPISTVNAGVAGESAEMGLRRLDRDVLSRDPDLVIVCFGLNDACGGMENLDAYTQALREIIGRLKERKIETVFLTPNMMNTYVSPLTAPESLVEIARHTSRIQTSGVMDAFVEAAVQVCAETGTLVCDGYGKWKALHQAGVDTTRLLANYVNHPTREMHGLFAAALLETLLGMGADPS